LLLTLAFLRGLIYAAVIPPWQAPDETGHFEYAWLIAHLGRLPTREDVSPAFEQELLGSLYEWRYGEFIGRPLPEGMPAELDDLPMEVFARRARTIDTGRFSLSYLWQALFLLPFRYQDLVAQLQIVRFSSILLNLIIVWLAHKTFSEILPDRPYLVCLMTVVVVFLPQHTFINSTVGDGPLAELMACLVLCCWARLLRRGVSVLTVAGIVLGTLAGIWAKTTAAFLIPLDAGLALWWFLRRPQRVWRWRHVVYAGIGVAILALAAWAVLQSPQGSNTLDKVWSSISADSLVWIDARGMTFGEALMASHDSFWANFGWMAVPVSSRWYGALLLLGLLAAFGWLGGRRNGRDSPSWGLILMGASFLVALAVFVWVALLSQSSGYYQFQGRYLFPVTVPFAFLLIGGLAQIRILRRRWALVGLTVIFLVLFDIWSMLGYVVPFFYSL
jgi:hypothetical protein